VLATLINTLSTAQPMTLVDDYHVIDGAGIHQSSPFARSFARHAARSPAGPSRHVARALAGHRCADGLGVPTCDSAEEAAIPGDNAAASGG
jgi:hypothetical protein